MTNAVEPSFWAPVWKDGSFYDGGPHRWPPSERDCEYHASMGRLIQPLYTTPSAPEAEKLRDALKPFARIAENISDVWLDGSIALDSALGRLTAGDFRQALAALQQEGR